MSISKEDEASLRQYKLAHENTIIQLQTDPENEGLLGLKSDLEELIALISNGPAAELKQQSEPPIAKKPPPPPVNEKWSVANHPAYQNGYKKPIGPQSPTDEPPVKTSFSVNDEVSARWHSGDGKWYAAKITSITGSASNPVYIVRFARYKNTETLSANDIKQPQPESKKRKADGNPVNSATSSVPVTTNVISAAANIDPALASQAKKEPSKVSDGPTRPAKAPRKVKANKELEAGKNKWQDFTTKGKVNKVAKKESMFRTPDGFNARVGFTGSGQEMRKDPSRNRHIYQQGAEDEGY